MGTEKRQSLNKNYKILIVEDHPIYRYGLTQLINQENNLSVCGEVEDTLSALKAIVDLKPDMVIVDISLKGTSGLDLIQNVKARYKDLPILVLSMHEESIYAERVLRMGARGYIMKQETYESVIEAIKQVIKGKIYVSENISEKMLHKFVDGTFDSVQSPLECLTNRELEVFRLIGMGYSTRKIASSLNLTINTINTHRDRIKRKLNLKNASELHQHAIHWIQLDNKMP